jgi:hypothetical protein
MSHISIKTKNNADDFKNPEQTIRPEIDQQNKKPMSSQSDQESDFCYAFEEKKIQNQG